MTSCLAGLWQPPSGGPVIETLVTFMPRRDDPLARGVKPTETANSLLALLEKSPAAITIVANASGSGRFGGSVTPEYAAVVLLKRSVQRPRPKSIPIPPDCVWVGSSRLRASSIIGLQTAVATICEMLEVGALSTVVVSDAVLLRAISVGELADVEKRPVSFYIWCGEELVHPTTRCDAVEEAVVKLLDVVPPAHIVVAFRCMCVQGAELCCMYDPADIASSRAPRWPTCCRAVCPCDTLLLQLAVAATALAREPADVVLWHGTNAGADDSCVAFAAVAMKVLFDWSVQAEQFLTRADCKVGMLDALCHGQVETSKIGEARLLSTDCAETTLGVSLEPRFGSDDLRDNNTLTRPKKSPPWPHVDTGDDLGGGKCIQVSARKRGVDTYSALRRWQANAVHCGELGWARGCRWSRVVHFVGIRHDHTRTYGVVMVPASSSTTARSDFMYIKLSCDSVRWITTNGGDVSALLASVCESFLGYFESIESIDEVLCAHDKVITGGLACEMPTSVVPTIGAVLHLMNAMLPENPDCIMGGGRIGPVSEDSVREDSVRGAIDTVEWRLAELSKYASRGAAFDGVTVQTARISLDMLGSGAVMGVAGRINPASLTVQVVLQSILPTKLLKGDWLADSKLPSTIRALHSCCRAPQLRWWTVDPATGEPRELKEGAVEALKIHFDWLPHVDVPCTTLLTIRTVCIPVDYVNEVAGIEAYDDTHTVAFVGSQEDLRVVEESHDWLGRVQALERYQMPAAAIWRVKGHAGINAPKAMTDNIAKVAMCAESLATISEGLRIWTQEAIIAVHSCECKRESFYGALECTYAFASYDEALKEVPTGAELCETTHLIYLAELAPPCPGQSDGVVYGRLLRAQTILDLGSGPASASEWFSKVVLVGQPAFFLRATQYSKWAARGTLKVDYADEAADESLVLHGNFSADVAIYHAICGAAPGWGGFRSGACLQPTSLAVKCALGDASDGAYVCLVSTLAAALSLPLDEHRAKCDATRMAAAAHRQMARCLQLAMASQRADAMEKARKKQCTNAVWQTAAAISSSAISLQAPALRLHVEGIVSCLLAGVDMADLGPPDVYSATLERQLAWGITGSIDDSALVLLLELRLLAILGGTPAIGEVDGDADGH